MALTITKTPSPVANTGAIQKPHVENVENDALSIKKDSFVPSEPSSVGTSTQMSILTGPTPGHNVVRIMDPKSGDVVEVPPRSASAIYALAQRWAQMMVKGS